MFSAATNHEAFLSVWPVLSIAQIYAKVKGEIPKRYISLCTPVRNCSVEVQPPDMGKTTTKATASLYMGVGLSDRVLGKSVQIHSDHYIFGRKIHKKSAEGLQKVLKLLVACPGTDPILRIINR
jgi:hypothetical protein